MKRPRSSALLVGPAFLLALGCGGAKPVEVKAAPDAADYAACPSGGAARVTGTSFARQRLGSLVFGSGRPVYLDPATRYSTAIFRSITDRQNKSDFFKAEKESGTVVPDPAMLKCRRTVQADADGKFTFDGVAPGAYFVSSYISWAIPSGEWLGSWNVRRLDVTAEGKNADVALNGVPESIPDAPAH